ncbi:MAG: NosD domain-containing protein, partial [Halobacteriota archaeon]|nr:NosD domain-containing protein [Halobacteriota archaeon]
KVTKNKLNSNRYCGIYLRSFSNSNMLVNNTHNSANGFGMFIEDSDNNRLLSNNISENKYGISLLSSNGNIIYNNYLSNTQNALDDGANIWSVEGREGKNILGASFISGNYWSDYFGLDTDGDGLGDTSVPYNSSGYISTGGDYHPLVMGGNETPLQFSKGVPGFEALFAITVSLALFYRFRKNKFV